MKAFPHFLVAGVLLLSAACSTSNTTDTAGSSTSGSSVTTDATGTGATSGSYSTTDATGTSTGSMSGSAGTSGTGSMAGTSGNTGTSASTSTGALPGSDMMAFMGTFGTMTDPTFLMNAASSNMLEIQLGQMAAQKASNADVRKFGQMMADHHTKATKELSTLASQMSVTLPTTMMPVHQAMADRLMNKSGKEFDEEYMDLMETAHKMDVAMFEVKSKGAETPTVKTFATKTLPMLRSHQTMASDIEKKVD